MWFLFDIGIEVIVRLNANFKSCELYTGARKLAIRPHETFSAKLFRKVLQFSVYTQKLFFVVSPPVLDIDE